MFIWDFVRCRPLNQVLGTGDPDLRPTMMEAKPSAPDMPHDEVLGRLDDGVGGGTGGQQRVGGDLEVEKIKDRHPLLDDDAEDVDHLPGIDAADHLGTDDDAAVGHSDQADRLFVVVGEL